MLKLHATVFAMPPVAEPGPPVLLRGLSLPTLAGPQGGPPALTAAMPVSFEAMQAQLLALPSSDCEPDGFFLVTGRLQGRFWRLSGHMHEHANAMHRVELNGECPPKTLDAVLRTMGWPGCELAFQLVQEGVTLTEDAFRAWAAAQ